MMAFSLNKTGLEYNYVNRTRLMESLFKASSCSRVFLAISFTSLPALVKSMEREDEQEFLENLDNEWYVGLQNVPDFTDQEPKN